MTTEPRGRTPVALIAALVALAGCDRGEPGRMPAPEVVPSAVVSQATRGPALMRAPATVRSTGEVEVATRNSGTVDRLAVQVGSRVRAGDTLALVDPSGVRSRIQAARAEAEGARAYWRRIAALAEDGAATPQELDDAVARKEAAEAALQEAEARMSYAVIRAPFDGMVSARLADPGDLAVPGRPILTLVRPGALKVVADLRESVAVRLSRGDRVTLRAGEEGTALPARVARIAPAVDRASHRVRVELLFDDAGEGALPLPGAYLRLEMEDPTSATLWVPGDALIRRGQLTGVYVAAGPVLELRWIRTGDRRGEAVEVLAGLEAGDPVVRRPSGTLVDGVAVERVEREPWTP